MSKTKFRLTDRVLAVIMAIMMTVSMLPTSVIASATGGSDTEERFTLYVVDSANQPIEGAQVNYSVQGTDVEPITGSETSGADGTVALDVLVSEVANGTYTTLSATVSKDGYEIREVTEQSIANTTSYEVELLENKLTGVEVTPTNVVYDGNPHPAAVVSGTLPTDVVTYRLGEAAATTDMPQITEAGEYILTVTVQRDGYQTYTNTVYPEIIPAKIALTVTPYSEEYDGAEHPAVAVEGILAGDTVTYQLGDNEPSNEIPMLQNVGKYTVKIEVTRANHEKYSASFTAEITAANIEGISVQADGWTYDGEAHQAVSVVGAQDGDIVEYNLNNQGWTTSVPSLTDAGTYNIDVRITRENYADLTIHATVSVAKAEQELAFVNEAFHSSTSKDSRPLSEFSSETGIQYDFAAKDATLYVEGSTISYSLEITDGNDETEIATLDEQTGLLTIKSPGSMTITAKLSGNENYKEAECVHELQVIALPDAAGDFIVFNEPPETYILGENAGVLSEAVAEKTYGEDDDGAVIYSIENTDIGIACDPMTGKLTVSDYKKLADAILKAAENEQNKDLTITVSAEKAEGKRYGADSASYEMTIAFAEIPEDIVIPFTLSPTDQGTWYSKALSLRPAAGYQAAQELSAEIQEDSFKDELEYTESNMISENDSEIGAADYQVVLRNSETGGIVSPMTFTAKIDTAAPSDIVVEYVEPVFSKLLDAVTVGLYSYYFGQTMTVRLSAKDAGSGVASFDLTLFKGEQVLSSQEGIIPEAEEQEDGSIIYVADVVVDKGDVAALDGSVCVKATDAVGHAQEKKDENIVILDTVAPGVQITYDQPTDPTQDSAIKYYQDEEHTGVTFNFSITENYFDAEGVLLEVTKDNAAYDKTNVEWIQDAENPTEYNGTLLLEDEGSYVIRFSYTDHSGNMMTDPEGNPLPDIQQSEDGKDSITYYVVIDRTAPKMDVEYDEDNQVLTVSVQETNFDPSRFLIKQIDEDTPLVADKSGAEQDDALNIEEYLQNEEHWKLTDESGENKYTAVVSFGANDGGIYNFKLSFSDLASRYAEEKQLSFTVDKNAPYDIEISYSKPVFSTLVDALTLGYYYQQSVEIKFTAYDKVSGVSHFIWSYMPEDGMGTVIKGAEAYSEICEEAIADPDSGNPYRYVATITLPADEADQLRGNIMCRAVDEFGNETENVTDGRLIIRDAVNPTLEVVYAPSQIIDKVTSEVVESEDGLDPSNMICYYGGATESGSEKNANIGIIITEQNMDLELPNPDVEIFVTKDGGEPEKRELEWSAVEGEGNKDKYIGELCLTEEGDYTFTVRYADRSQNPLTYEGELIDPYTSAKICLDRTAPDITLGWETKDVEQRNSDYYRTRTLTLTVAEEHFDPKHAAFSFSGDGLREEVTSSLTEFFSNRDNWSSTSTETGTEYVSKGYELPEAVYDNLTVTCCDLATNIGTVVEEETFTVDRTGPRIVDVAYSNPTVPDKFLEKITYGFYQAKATVRVTMTDNLAGVDLVKWTYTREEGASESNQETDTGEVEAADIQKNEDGSFVVYIDLPKDSTVPENERQLRGYLTIVAFDCSNNSTSYENQNEIVVIDTIKPEVAEISYGEVTVTDLNFKPLETIPEDGNYILHSESSVTATLVVKEANFFPEDITLSVERNDNAIAAPEIVWEEGTVDSDSYRGTFTITEPETAEEPGAYEITLLLKDHSGNESVYTSPMIHLDRIAPDIEITFPADEIVYNEKYYPSSRTATITVTEQNFYAEYVSIHNFEAKDIFGNDIEEAEQRLNTLNATLQNPDKWESEGAVHTINITFPEDAVYVFSVTDRDIVGNRTVSEEYSFVVDSEAPTDLKVTYTSTPKKLVEEEGVTYGFYRPDEEESDSYVTITIQATDVTSGVDYFTWSYNREDGASESNVKAYLDRKIEATPDSKDSSLYTAEIILPESIADQLRGSITFYATDMATNSSDPLADDNYVIVVDTIAPGRDVAYSDAIVLERDTMLAVDEYEEGDDVILYYQTEATVTLTIKEANFYSEDVKLAVKKDGVELPAEQMPEITWQAAEQADTYLGTFSLTEEGDYTFTVTLTDRSGNPMTTYNSHEIHIDNTKPVISVEYTSDAEAKNGKYFKADRTAIITIVEHNFLADAVASAITAVNVAGDPLGNAEEITNGFARALASRDSWRPVDGVEDTYVARITFSTDAAYTFSLSFADIVGNEAVTYTADPFVIDHAAPTDPVVVSRATPVIERVIAALTFGFYDPSVTYTIQANDEIAGIDYFDWSYTRQDGVSTEKNAESETGRITDITYSEDNRTATASFTLSAEEEKQYRGSISFTATDRAGNTNGALNDNAYVSVVDTIAPDRTVAYSEARVLDRASMTDVESYTEGQDVILYYQTAATVTLTVTEANFYSEDVVLAVTKNGTALTAEELPAISWTDESADVHVGTFTLAGDGDYTFTVNLTDRSGNVMNTYASHEIRIDATAPQMTVSYASAVEALNGRYYSENRTATITIVDHNFLADAVVAVVTAQDVQGNDIAGAEEIANGFASYLRSRSSWTAVEGEADTYQATITFAEDAQYTFSLSYADIIGNAAESYLADPFVVDHTPATDAVVVSRVTPVAERILSALTFGFYNPNVTYTIQAGDDISGVDYFNWSFARQSGAAESNVESESGVLDAANITYSENGRTATASFTLTAEQDIQYRGSISFTATDRAGNTNGALADNAYVSIVDTISPEISISYDMGESAVRYVNANGNDAESFEEASHVYVGGTVTATITINETNFFDGSVQDDGSVIHQVGLLLTAVSDSGNESRTEYLPAGAAQMFDNADTQNIEWTREGDTYTITLVLSDSADYVLTAMYADLSGNASSITANDGTFTLNTYTSKTITVDKNAPRIYVDYTREDPINVIDGRAYFDQNQSAEITIRDHNFRASEVAVVVTAQDVTGADVLVQDYAAQLSDESAWRHYDYAGNRVDADAPDAYRHVADIQFTTDANYTFDISYIDLALNHATDYTEDLFTVDKANPYNLSVQYSTPVWSNILESISFLYYNARATVTVSADDDTSGIWHYLYSYVNAAGVSSVNAQLLNEAISNATITQDGKTFSATFQIPREALRDTNQFNGIVRFTAYDRVERNTDAQSTTHVIVDNIAPVGTVTFSQPVQNVGDVSYYAGDIQGTITITEANFFAEDVTVLVNNTPISVQWVNNSVDLHTGSFTLSGDGDYVVTVQYADRSSNTMATYTSNQLTIDTIDPVITVSNIQNQSANNAETISVSVSVTDRNIESSSFTPALSAIVRVDNGDGTYSYERQTISLGSPAVSTNGSGDTVYTYTIANLDVDGYYSLTASATDNAGHTVSSMTAENTSGGTSTVQEVDWSVNRNGSTFSIETRHNDKYSSAPEQMLENQLNDSFANDRVEVVIYEYNVDLVNTDATMQTVLTLNDGSAPQTIELVDTAEDSTGNYDKNLLADSAVSSDAWYTNVYTLDNSYFDHDGTYSVNLLTYDRATNSNINSKDSSGMISFVLDRTAPVVTANIVSGQNVNEESFTVEFMINDLNLNPETIAVTVNGSEVVPESIGANEYTFVLDESSASRTIEITAQDYAGNTAEAFRAENVTISSNVLVIFYANKPLFWGSVAGVVGLTAILVVIILVKRRKKDEETR